MAPPNPKVRHQSLPPILRIICPKSLSSCSQGARGLSVLMRVTGIFTGITSSLCPSLRQLSDRYAIRAGRNLPDKEFRYLRTVIVTAAIHWGFDSELRSEELTSPLNLPALGRRQPPYVVFTTLRRPVFLLNSRLRQFSATAFLVNAATLLPKLRVHFAEFLNEGSHKHLRILIPPT